MTAHHVFLVVQKTLINPVIVKQKCGIMPLAMQWGMSRIMLGRYWVQDASIRRQNVNSFLPEHEKRRGNADTVCSIAAILCQQY